MIKIMIQKETLISAVSSTVSFLIMLIGALTHTRCYADISDRDGTVGTQ